jgi:hypothetical protein
MIDTSGSYPPPAIQATIQQAVGGGVYTDQQGPGDPSTILAGRISLGMVAAAILGAVAFYLWTHSIQGGG